MFFTLPKNTKGRDFIAGDLHGAYKDLCHILEHINFNKSEDRLFLVGDLVDRGPASLECLRLINEPYVYSVLGNHEEMLFDAVTSSSPTAPQFHAMNGGVWAMFPDEELHSLASKANDLPIVHTVEDSFSVMHAEPPFLKDDLLDYSLKGWGHYNCLDGAVTTWGRRWFLDFYGKDPTKVRHQPIPYSSKIQTLYCGHTPVLQPLRLGFLVNLDTGASKQGYLTVHCHTTNETFSYVDGKVIKNTIFVYRG